MAEEGVGGVDGAAEAEGGVYPVVGVGMRLMVLGRGSLHRRSIVEVILRRILIPALCCLKPVFRTSNAGGVSYSDIVFVPWWS